MTTAATTDLAACLALVSEATPGRWASINSIPEEGVECFWIEAQPGGGICRGFTQEIGCVNGPQSDDQEANARLIPAAVNYLRTHGDTLQRALALLAAVESGEWKCVPVEATEAMLRAGVEGVYGPATYKCVSRTGTELYEQEADSNYTAMLAAAPAAPGVEG